MGSVEATRASLAVLAAATLLDSPIIQILHTFESYRLKNRCLYGHRRTEHTLSSKKCQEFKNIANRLLKNSNNWNLNKCIFKGKTGGEQFSTKLHFYGAFVFHYGAS